MKKCLIVVVLSVFLILPAHGAEITAPPAPDSAQELLPMEQENFLDGLTYVLQRALEAAVPSIYDALSLCAKALAIVLCLCILRCFGNGIDRILQLCSAVLLTWLLIGSTDTFLQTAAETVRELSAYGKLLLPVMTTALAAQGGAGTATALYSGTAIFDALLSGALERLLVPMVYGYLALALLAAATDNKTLHQIKKGIYQFATKGLRLALYLFTGYLTITGVIGGSADQMQLKAAKLTISGMVPVVGNILADASETILVSAGLVKSAVGIYGLLAIVATALVPILSVGIRYLLLKATAAAGAMLGGKEDAAVIADFGAAMGLLLAVTMSQTLLLLVSTVCFMKGMGS